MKKQLDNSKNKRIKDNQKHFLKKANSRRMLFFIAALFLSVGAMQTAKAQNTVAFTAGTLPAAIVISGDPVTFSVTVTNTTSALMPAGYKLKVFFSSANWYINSATVGGALTVDSRQGDTVTFLLPSIAAMSGITVNISVTPKCGITGGADYIYYTVYDAGGQRKSDLNFNAYTGGIANVLEPIMSFTPQGSATALLNVNVTRTHSITQTQPGAYARQVRVVQAVDTNTVQLIQLEASRDNSTWVSVADSLITRAAGRYTYNFNSLLMTQLGYTSSRLNANDVIYFRETVKLRSCTGNSVSTYTNYYGANGQFCTTTTTGTAQVVTASASFSADVRTIDYLLPNRNGRTEGRTRLRLLNNSTDPNATMRDVRVPVFHTPGVREGKYGYNLYRNTKAYLINPSTGALLTGSASPTDTIFLPMYANHGFATINDGTIVTDANTYVVVLDSLKAADNVKIAYAINTYGAAVVGLYDADGDGIYNDLRPGREFGIAVHHVNNMSIHTSCESQFRNGTIRIAYLAWKNSCNQIQMFHQTYTTNAANQTSQVWVARTYFSALNGVQTIPVEIQPGQSVILKVSQAIATGSSNSGEFAQNNTFYEHFAEVTLPEGFEFVGSSVTNAIQINRTVQAYPGTIEHTVASGDISYNSATRVIRFKYSGYIVSSNDYTMQEGQNFYIKVNVLNTIQPAATTNKAAIKHIFRYGDEPGTEYSYSCSDLMAVYNIVQYCSDFELSAWTVERTSFGFNTTTNQTPLTPVQIAADNKNVAFQRDNVDLTARGYVLGNITQSATNQLVATLGYTGNNGATNRYFDVLSTEVRVRRGASNYVYTTNNNTLPASAVSQAFTTAPSPLGYYHSIKVDCQAIGNLQTGDSVILTVHTRTKDNIPNMLTGVFIPNMYMQWNVVTNGVTPDCNKFLKDNFTLRNNNFSTVGNSSNQSTYNIGAGTGTSLLLTNYISSGNRGWSGTVYPRSNFQVISDTMVFKLNGLYKIKTLNNSWISFSVPLAENIDYTVSYANDQTVITILHPQAVNNGYSDFAFGYFNPFYFSAEHIWYNGINVYQYMRILDGPTSAQPIEKKIGVGTSLSRSVFDYNYNLSSSQPLAEPLTSRASWPLTISNLSSWGSSYSNDTLHYSWIAIEDESQSLSNPQLYYPKTGQTFTGIPYTSLDGTKTYYWFQIGNLKAAAELFTLSANYTSCSSRIDFIAKYSCSKGDYPFDPARGYQQYNSNKLNTVKQVALALLPPQGAISGTLAVSTTPATPPNSYDICDPICYTATMRSGMNSSLYNPIVVLRKADGMAWDGNMSNVSATYKGGAVSGAINVVETADSILFILPASVEIEGVSSGGGDLAVNFCLLMGDGFIANTPSYAYLTAETGCGERYSFLTNSANVKIEGFPSNMPIFNMLDFEASDLTYSTNGEGTMTLTGMYTIIANPSEGTYSFITLPDNLRLISGTLTSGSYSANYTTTRDRHVIKAPFSNDPGLVNVGVEYTVNLTLQATSPGSWSCRSDSIHTSSGITMQFYCSRGTFNVSQMSDISTVQEFEIKKVELAFDPSGTAIQGEYFSPTQERVTVNLQLANNSALPSGAVKVELFLDNDGDGTLSFGDGPVLGNPYIGIANIGGYDGITVSRNFILNAADICKLMLVIRQESNPYICSNIAYNPPIKDFRLPQSEITLCQNTPATVGTEPMSGYSYSWIPVAYLSATNTANPEFNYPVNIVAPEQLAYYVTITRPGNCSVTKRLDITVNPLPHLSNALLLDTICSGGVAYSEISTLTPGEVTFSWFRPAVSGINGNAANVGSGAMLLDVLNNSSNSVKTVKYIYTATASGCSGKDTLRIDVFGQASVGNLATPAAICDGALLVPATPAIQSGGSAITAQNWLLDGTPFNPATPLHTSDNGKHLKYVLSTACGDYSSNEVVVTVNPYPTLQSIQNHTQCSGEVFGYTLSSTVAGVGLTWERIPEISLRRDTQLSLTESAEMSEFNTPLPDLGYAEW
jgi:hypothetical protein